MEQRDLRRAPGGDRDHRHVDRDRGSAVVAAAVAAEELSVLAAPRVERASFEVRLHRIGEQRGRLQTFGRRADQGAHAEPVQVRRDTLVEAARRRRQRAAGEPVQHLGRRPVARRLACKDVVEDRAETIDVGGEPHLVGAAACLFGGP